MSLLALHISYFLVFAADASLRRRFEAFPVSASVLWKPVDSVNITSVACEKIRRLRHGVLTVKNFS
jgi:hypothetical protein